MAPFITASQATSVVMPQPSPLNRPHTLWPVAAREAYRGVLDQLDSWCRTHDEPRMLNSWIAEEAVRQSW